MTDKSALIRIDAVKKSFTVRTDKPGRFGLFSQREEKTVLKNISLDIQPGETLCLIGESGSGKSTLARLIMGLEKPSSGSIHYDTTRLDTLSSSAWLPYRTRMQMFFQNPYASLNPRMTIGQTLREPIQFHAPQLDHEALESRVQQIMESVGIDARWRRRYPHELSAGQRQRISIARALSVDPEFIIADEPVASLDLSVQAQVLNLMQELQQARQLTYLVITHDLAIVEHIADRVAVLYQGKLCEIASAEAFFTSPQHPYSQRLLATMPYHKR